MVRQRGMTLMEVMMALVVATVGLLGAVAMISVLFRTSTYSRNLSEAMALVQAKLEAEVSRTPISLSSPANATTTESAMDALGNTSGSALPFTRATTWAASTDGKRRLITVTVTFNDVMGIPHTVLAERERNTP
jgi:prepilin-type N-terminal cleavage/methylation domain-containing protein